MDFKVTNNEPFGLQIKAKQVNGDIWKLPVPLLRELLYENFLLIFRGFCTFSSSDEFSKYCELWGEISIWPFGKVLELKEQTHPIDHIFDNNDVPLHWDGMYRSQLPELQIFHCVKAPPTGHGGKTTFSNTVTALKKSSLHQRSTWEKVTGSYERKMEFYHSKTISPIIDFHPLHHFQVIRYNEALKESTTPFLNPPLLEFSGLREDEFADFHHNLKKVLYAPSNFYAHEWQEDDLIIADNFSLLHGREAFLSMTPRHLRRVHVLSNPPFANPRLVFNHE